MESIQPGTRLGHYRIVSRLGAGGMGEVFRAVDVKLERPVAIKVLPPALARDEEAIERLEREAKAASTLNHPGIVTIHAIEAGEGRPYIVMELVEGGTLRERIRRGPLETAELIAVGSQVADALAAAHAVGLIHRDIKSSNILLTRDGRPKLADFGLAKRLPSGTDPDATAAVSLTATGVIVGTAAYMSPEQSRGRSLDARSDIFSLGVVLYEAATGRLPFEGPTVLSILHEIALVEPPAPSRVRAGLVKGLDHVLRRAMAKDRERRYATAVELAAALRGIASEAPLPEEEAARPGAPPPASAVPNNLPVAFTSFVGRQDEMEEIARLLGSSRLVTLAGAGGCGKSRLAAQIARNTLEGYPDGAWMVELAALAEPSLVPGRVGQVLGVREETGRPILETLRDALASRTLLLILDNCEHLTASCAEVASVLVRSCPSVRILATSREPLGVPGEAVWRVPPLSAPKPEQASGSRKEIGRYESVRLFLERAVAALPTFTLTDENAPVIGQICAQLDGIPLAIELASARVKILPPAQILARLQDRFRLLRTGGSGEIAHHQTLRAAVDWSYELLSGEERTLFDRLSVFAGGATLEAVEAVCPGEGLLAEEILDLLSNLVDKSLVQPEEGAGGSARYRLLETLRAYGKERLEGGGAQETALGRHLAYYLALAEEAEPELNGKDQSRWLARLEEEHDNLRQASESTVRLRRAAEALRLAGALWRFWRIHGHFGEGRLRLEAALSLDDVGGGAKRARMKALLGAGALARSQSDYERARRLLEEGVAIGRAAGEEGATAALLLELGNVAEDQGERVEARALYEECLAIRRGIGDRRGAALVLHNLGVIAQALGEGEAAARLYEQSLVISRELKNERGEALSLNALGSVALDREDFAAAQRSHDEALAIHRRLGDRWGIAYTLHELGRAATGLAQHEKAHALLAESLAMAESLGDRVGAVEALEHFAVLAAAEGQHERALLLAGAAAAVREELGAPLTPPDQANLESRLARSKEAMAGRAPELLERGRLTRWDRAVQLAAGERSPSGMRTESSGTH